MADYGAAVSQEGYDVKTCADRFLVYSSAFQSLKVFSASAVSTTVPASGVNTITINHNLGYLAPYFIVYNGSSTIGTATSYFGGVDSTNLVVTTERMYTNSLEIDVPEGWESTDTGSTVYFTVYIFLDDFTALTENVVNTGTSSGATSTDYGFRISKPGYDVKTCNDIDCILSSSYFTHVVDKKGSTTGTSVAHGLGYLPAAFAFKLTGTYIEKITVGSDASNIYFVNPGSATIYYIIFKNQNG